MNLIESPLSIVKYNRPGIKNPLRTNLTRGNLNAVGGSQLKYAACITLISGIATNSITAISCILSPKFNIFKPFRVFSLQSSPTNRLMLVRWWFSFARFIKKETKSCCINRSTPRTDRQSQWNLHGMGSPSTSMARYLLGKGGRYVFKTSEARKNERF